MAEVTSKSIHPVWWDLANQTVPIHLAVTSHLRGPTIESTFSNSEVDNLIPEETNED